MDLKNYGELYALFWREYKELSKASRTDDEAIERKSALSEDAKEIRRRLEILYDIIYREGNEVNIFAQEEFQVIYNGRVKSFADNIEENIKAHLIIDNVYTVKEITPYDSYAIVELKEFPGVVFEAAVFDNYSTDYKSMEELLDSYGPGLERDIERVQRLIEEVENKPALSDIGRLEKLYDEYRGKSVTFVDALEEMCEFIDVKNGRTSFKVGNSFYDGYRKLEILSVSDDVNTEDNLVYFCSVTEDLKNITWYGYLDQVEMEVVRIADTAHSEGELTEKERLIRGIVYETGGILWPFAECADENKSEDKPQQKYSVGQCINLEEGINIRILDISPDTDCYNEWIYFYKREYIHDDNTRSFNYYAEPEDMMLLGVDNLDNSRELVDIKG